MDALTIKETAKYLRCSESLVRKILKTKGLRYLALGNRKLIQRSDLEAWIEEHMEKKELA